MIRVTDLSMYDRVSKQGVKRLVDTNAKDTILYSRTLIPLNECLGCVNNEGHITASCINLLEAGTSEKILMPCEVLAFEDIIEKAIMERQKVLLME